MRFRFDTGGNPIQYIYSADLCKNATFKLDKPMVCTLEHEFELINGRWYFVVDEENLMLLDGRWVRLDLPVHTRTYM